MTHGYVGNGSLTAPTTAPPAHRGPGSPGKRTLVEQIQLRPGSGAVPSQGDAASRPGDAIHAAASRGVAAPASSLPYRERIQRLFGRHDISAVQAHVGSDAQAAAADMGARAYATGDHVVLGENPDLHTVAHEVAHTVQQRGGVQLQGGVGAAGDAYERHADEVADRVVQGQSAEALLDRYAGAGAAGGVANAPVQLKWLPSPYHDEFYEWDQVVAGLRWYVHKEHNEMYFIVVQPTEENRRMVGFQQQIKTYEQWLELGFAAMEDADNSVVEEARQPQQALGSFAKHDAAPFVYSTTTHETNQKRTFMRDKHEFRQPKKGNDFPKGLDVAVAKGMPVGIKDQDNVEKFVFHLTSFRNLVNAPDDSMPGIMTTGLQPALGGGKGGACETSQVTANPTMVSESQEHSKNRIAVNTGPSNVMLYVNQRLDYNTKQFGEGLYSETDLVERDPVLLRFRLTKAQIDSMVVDPKHPKDRHVRLIQDIAVPREHIEALTSEGWWPVGKLDLGALKELMPNVKTLDK